MISSQSPLYSYTASGNILSTHHSHIVSVCMLAGLSVLRTYKNKWTSLQQKTNCRVIYINTLRKRFEKFSFSLVMNHTIVQVLLLTVTLILFDSETLLFSKKKNLFISRFQSEQVSTHCFSSSWGTFWVDSQTKQLRSYIFYINDWFVFDAVTIYCTC